MSKYFEGKPCSKCGTTLKYTSSIFCCVQCTKDASRRRHHQMCSDPVSKAKVRRSWKKAGVKRRYGMTIECYDAMLASQGGKCAICNHENTLVVDHDHGTGKVREMLCSPCNKALGFFRDNIEVAKSAIRYLEKHG